MNSLRSALRQYDDALEVIQELATQVVLYRDHLKYDEDHARVLSSKFATEEVELLMEKIAAAQKALDHSSHHLRYYLSEVH